MGPTHAPALSFRDQCAIAAMQKCVEEYTPEGVNELADHAFNVADAMEAERQKRSTQ